MIEEDQGWALGVLKAFLHADLVERNADKALLFLSRNIRWYGTADTEDVHGLAEAEDYLRDEMAASPTPYVVDYLWECDESQSPDFGAALVKCCVTGGGATLLCRCSASLCREDGALKIYALHMSVPDAIQKSGEFFPFSLAQQYEQELHEEFLNELVDGGILGRYCDSSAEIYLVNQQLLDFLGYPSEEVFRRELHNNANNSIYPEDREGGCLTIREQLANSRRYHVEYRMLRRDGSPVWVESHGKLVVTRDGRKALVGIINDISIRKKAELLAEVQNREIRNLYDTIPGGVFICKFNLAWDVTFANQGFYTFLGYTRQEFSEQFHNQMWGVIYEEDRGLMVPVLQAQLAHGNYVENTNRLVCKGGKIKWISIHAVLSSAENGEQFFYCTFVDITPQKEAEQKLLESEQRYRIAVEGANISIWEYDVPNRRIMMPKEKRTQLHLGSSEENTPESIAAQLGMTPDQAEELHRLFARIEAGEPKVSADLWLDSPLSHTRRCERVTYSVEFDRTGAPVRAYGASVDVTQSKFAEKRYQEELAYRDSVSDSVAASCCVNLTTRVVESMRIHGRTASDYENLVDYRQRSLLFLYGTQISDAQNERLSPDALIRRYNDGISAASEEFLACLSEKCYCWLRADVNLVKRPETGEILAFFYNRDLTDYLIRTHVLNTVLTNDYEEVGIIDLRTDTYKKSASDGVAGNPGSECSYAEKLDEFCARRVAQSERLHMRKVLQLAYVREQLERHATYDVRFLGLTEQQEPQFFQMRYQHLGSNPDILLVTRQNVDEIVKREVQKQRELEKANQVKNEFLSRMSHEIRTPLNAIIGLAELGRENLAQPVPDRQEGRDYVMKTLDASRYLLSLLNDILDMSKIESGEIKLSCEQMDCPRILDSIHTIIATQAKLKHIDYQVEKHGDCPHALLGDGTRVEQVLINLLNNAVKFTPEGGRVRLTIDKLSQEGNLLTMRFVVADTGVGIAPEFLNRIFEPFVQEYAGITSAYGGSGLGLAIARRLTRLMDGDLTVESQKGHGSTFTAIMCFQIPASCEEREQMASPQNKGHSLEGKRFLLCEDHPLNTMVIERLLKRQGCIVDCVENGKQGVARFEQSVPGVYDGILMDIRMPEMDGLTATRIIRASAHPEAKRIPIIAMTANAYAEDLRLSQEAGMNAHLSKPIEPQLLYQTLSNLCSKLTQE